MPLNVSDFLVSLAITAVAYGAGPLLLRLRKGPVPPKALKWFHIGYTVVLAIAFAAYNSLNGYKVNLYPTLIWGSIFYWWNRSYFEKRSYPPVQPATIVQAAPASTDPAPPEPELPAVIPEKKVKKAAPRALVIVLAAALVLSLAGNIWQGVSWASGSAKSAEEIRVLNNKITQLNSAIASYRDNVGELKSQIKDLESRNTYFNEYMVLNYRIGFIVDGSAYYHRYSCPVYRAADECTAHNIEYCRYLGYSACPVCWD